MFQRKSCVFQNVSSVLVLSLLIFFSVPCVLSAEEKADVLDELSLYELRNLVITTAGKKEEKVSEIPASVVVITRKQIETYGYRTVQEILENVPGFYAIDNMSENGVTFGVRGFWSPYSKNIMLMVNGVSQLEFAPEFSYPLDKAGIPVEAIDRIEIVRGPMSVIYGSNAFLGAVNIITNEIPEKEGGSGLVSASYGSENSKKAVLRNTAKQGDLSYSFNASIFDTDGVDEPYSRMMSNPSLLQKNYGFSSGETTTKGKYANNEKHLSLSVNYKDFYATVAHNETEKGMTFSLPFPGEDGMTKDYKASTALFGYKKKLSDMFTVDGKLTYSQSHAFYNFAPFVVEPYVGFENDFKFYEAELDVFAYPLPNLDVTLGLYYRSIFELRQNLNFGDVFPAYENTTMGLPEDEEIQTRALFIQVNYTPWDPLKVVAGIRLEQMMKHTIFNNTHYGYADEVYYDGTDEDGDEISVIPRLAAIYNLNDNHIFKLMYGKSIARSFNDLNILVANHNNPGANYPYLKPEEIQTVELNYSALLSSKFSLNLSLFRNELDKLYTRKTEVRKNEQGELVYSPLVSSSGKMHTTGAEVSVLANLSDNLDIEVGGTYQDTVNDENKDIEPGMSPQLLGYIKASYKRELGFAQGIFSLTGNYVDEMESYWNPQTINQDGSLGARSGEKTDGYFSVGANVRLNRLFSTGWYVSLKGSNLLDEEINYPTYAISAWADKGTLGHGRLFMFTAGYNF